LTGSERFVKQHAQVYNKRQDLFGLPGSELRIAVKNRRIYLEKLRVSRPDRFLELCLFHGLAAPVPASPPPAAIEFAATGSDSSVSDSMSGNRNYRRRGEGKTKLSGLL
jgi:hypothetical protein